MSADPFLGISTAVEPVVITPVERTVISAALLNNSSSVTVATQREPSGTGSIAAEQTREGREIVFVDSRVNGHEQFVKDLVSQTSGERRIDVRILDPERDGIEQVSQTLGAYSDLAAVHLISHGTDGAVQLGATWLDSTSLSSVADSIAGWRASLSAEADLLFYGCDLAASPTGVTFIEQLSLLTGADVAASADLTGNSVLGGDWVLERAVGSIQTAVAPSTALQQNWNALLANIAPTASNMNAAENYTLSTPLNLADIVVSDVDSPNVTVRLTLSNTAAGRLSIGTSGSVTSTYNAGTGVWTASGAVADVNVLLANVTYTPSFLFLGSFTIATRVDDGVAPALTGVKNVSLALLNLPLSATNRNTPENYTEDTPLNLTNIVISDLDSPNVTARLTLSNAAAGSLNTGSSGEVVSTYNPVAGVWSASGAIADVNALLAGLTFTPAANYDGDFTIATRVDDGAAGALTGVKNMNGLPVNDAPAASNLNAPETYTVDEALNLADIVISDVDSANVTAGLTLSDPSAGTLNTATSGSVTSTYNPGTGQWVASGALAHVNTLLAGLTFTPAAAYNSPFTIATSVDDGLAPALMGTKNVSSNFVNTPALATNLNAAETYSEDTPLDLTDIVVSDADSVNATVTLTLSASAAGSLNTANSGLVTSTYDAATGVWSASGAIADVNTLLAGLTFTPALNYNGNFTIATSVDDGLAPALTDTKSMTGTPVNDAPAANNISADETYTEDTPLDLTDIVVSDVDSANVTMTLTLSAPEAGNLNTATSGLVTSTYNAGTGVWSASGAIADVNILLAGLTFTPALDYDSDFTIATSVDDGVGGTTTGVKATTGMPVNDAPAASNLSAGETYTEDTPLNLTNIVVSDVDSANVIVMLTLSAPAAGSLNTATSGLVTSTYNAGTGIWSASGAIADVNVLLAGLTFTPALNYNSNFMIATSVDDGVNPAMTGTKNMTGTAVNDAPVNSVPGLQFTAQDTSLIFDASNGNPISIGDVDALSSQVEVTLTATNGTVTLNWPSGTAIPAGGEFRVNSVTSDDQANGATTNDFGSRRAVAADPSGNFIVTWSSKNQDGSGWGVYAQRYNAAGAAQGGAFRVNTSVANDQVDASIAVDDAGNFVIVWASKDQDGNNWGIYAQRYDAGGAAQGTEFRVNTSTNKEQLGPSIAMDSSGDFVIAWSSKDQDGDNWGVYAKRFNANGAVQGGEFRVNTSTSKEQTAASVAMDDDGDFVVTWSSKDQDGDNWGVYAKRYNAAGLVQGSDFLVNTFTAKDQAFSSVGMDADGNFVVTWSSKDEDGDNWGVYAQRYDALGMAQGTAFQVNQSTAKEQMHSSVSLDVDGDFVITWSSKDQDGSGWGIYARQFDAAGTAKTGETLVNGTTSGDQEYSSAAMDAQGNFVVAWSGNGPGDTEGVFAQRFTIASPLTFTAGDGTRDTVMTVRGTQTQINSVLDGLVFTPTSGFNGMASITVATNDLGNSGSGGVQSDSDAININVGGSNIAPTLTLTGGALDYTENDPATVIDSGVTVSDPDSADFNGGQFTVFFSAGGTDNDRLAIRNQGIAAGEIGVTGSSVTYNFGAGAIVIGSFTGGTDGLSPLIVTLNANATATAVQALARNITYQNLSDNPSTLERIAQFALTDGDGGTSGGAARSINLAAVNDAPLATNLNATETYTEDTPLDLTDIVVSDDSTNVTVTLTLSAPAAGGLNTATSGLVTSTYNAGTGVWTASGEVADVNALLAGLTFTPALNYNSDFTIATSVDDGVAPPITGTKNMTGTAVNDAPALVDNTLTINEGGSVVLSGSEISATDVDNAGASLTFTASGVSGGQFELVANPGVAITSFTQGQVSGGAIRFVHDGGEAAPSYQVTVSDGTLSDGPAAATINFTSQNDAPTATNLNAAETYTEDTPLNLTDIVVSDVDSANVSVTMTLSDVAAGSLSTATSGAVTSIYNAVTGSWSASGAIADVNTLLAGLTFTPALNYNSNFTIATSVDDGVAPAITGTKNITGTAVNDAPAATNLSTAEIYLEETPLNLNDIVVSDVDSTNAAVTLTLSDAAAGSLNSGTSGLVTSTYNPGTGVWTASGTIADINVLLAGLTFTPALNYSSAFTISTSVADGAGGTIGGVKAMTGIAVNDAPLATNLNAAETYTEETPLDLTDIVVSDVDSTAVTVTLTLSDVAAGSLNTATSALVTSTYNAGTGVWTASGEVADVNILLAGLTFTPALNYNGDFTIATSVDDGVAPPITGTKNMTGTAVNDAPALVDNTLTINEGGSVVLSGSEISATDVDNAGASLTFTASGVSGGQFELVANPGVAITSFTQGQVSGGAIRFVHDGGEAAPSYQVTVSDGTLSDGPAAATINFTNQNDAPTATNLSAGETYTEDTPLNLTDIVVSDVDNANVTVTLTLSDAAAGSLNTGTSGLVTSTYNAGPGVWTVSGAVADVNTLLAGLTFTPALNYNSDFTIATSVDDGVAPAITGTKNMTGTAVNDTPVLVNNALIVSEGGSVVLSGSEISATDVDNAAATLAFMVSGVSGGQFELVGNPGVAITSFTQGQVGGGAIRFVHDGGEAAPSYQVTVSDGTLSDGPSSSSITFTNINDAPALGNNQLAIDQGSSVALSSANISATDVDDVAPTLAFALSNVSGGHFELAASPGIVITSFTQAQIGTGGVRFVHDGSAAAPRYEVTVSDGRLSYGPVAATITFNRSDENVEPIPTSPTPGPIAPPVPIAQPNEEPVEAPAENPNSAPGDSSTGGPDNPPSPATLSDDFANEFQAPGEAPGARDADIVSATPPRIIQRQNNENREARDEGLLLTPSSELEDSTTGNLTGGDLSSVVEVNGLVQGLNKLREEVHEETYLEKLVVGSTLTATTGFSIGYVLWLVRGEVLLTSLLASLPAWRLIDPLPVLSFLNKRSEDEEEDDDSLQAAVAKGNETQQLMPVPPQQSGLRSVKWRIVTPPADSIAENRL